MATLRKARDNHFYIVEGYPFENEDGEKDAFFATLQVGPRADSLFRILEVKDGYQIEKPLYYCLAVEGDIHFNGKADHPPSPLKIPSRREAIRVASQHSTNLQSVIVVSAEGARSGVHL